MATLPVVEEAPGRVRPMRARWLLTGTLELETAAHFGGIEDPMVDLLVQRDAVSGAPLLVGTSLTGALRGYLGDWLGGYRSLEDKQVASLFGGTAGDDQGAQSPLIVFDSLGRLSAGLSSEIRDGVKIDESLGTAEKHKKFDRELLPAGTRFDLRFELVIGDESREQPQLSLLATALEGLERGEVSLGARRSRGLGRSRVKAWRLRRFDLASRQGWLEWLLSDPAQGPSDSVLPSPSIRQGISQALASGGGVSPAPATGLVPDGAPHAVPDGAAADSAPGLPGFADRRQRFSAQVDLLFPAGLLVRSPGLGPADSDAAHLRSGGKPVLPGTGVAGALRARAGKILRCLRPTQKDAGAWVDRLFGPSLKGTTDIGFVPWASRLRVAESEIASYQEIQQTRVGIDRFTQGVFSGALLEEQPVVAAKVYLDLELRDPEPGEVGLLLLLIKDLISGDLPLGGTSSVGRGFAQGEATLRTGEGDEIPLSQESGAPAAALPKLQDWIDVLVQSPALVPQDAKKGATA